jgi:putative FmdB family regulatory protein
MPLYEYKCTTCQRHTEKIQKFSDPEITACPHCGGLLQRVISAPAFALKGGGWYADGYASAKPGSSATADSTPAASTNAPAPTPAPAASPAPATASVGAKT